MSTEKAPWILALDGVECRICGHSIKLQYAAENPNGPGAWRGYAQDLQLASRQSGPQPLVPAEICFSTFQGETRTMHAACWKIVESIWKAELKYTMAELDGFLDVSSDLAPFLPEIPYTVSPIEIDADLLAPQGSGRTTHQDNSNLTPTSEELLTTLESEGFVPPLLHDIKNHALPTDLDRHVRRWLLSDHETQEVDDDSSQDPAMKYWSSVASMLAHHPQFANVPPAKIAEDVTRILQSLHDGGSLDRFPHIVNFDRVYANAITILLALLKLPLDEIQSEPDLNGNRARLQTSRSIKLPPALDTPAKLKLQLSTLRRQSYAEGDPDRQSNLRVGMKYMRDVWFGPADAEVEVGPDDVVVEVPSFAGLRFIRDHVGICAALAKQGETWRTCWEQNSTADLQEEIPGTQSTVVEWQAGIGQPHFLIVSNTHRDILLLDQNGGRKERNSKREKLKKLFGRSKE